MADTFDLDLYEAIPNVTSEYVLDQIDDLLIYRYYLGAFQLGKPFKSPFRNDSTPSFSITLNNTWLKLMWKDFGTGEAGDCFKLVSKLKKISYPEAIQQVACDFGLIKGSCIVTKKQISEAREFKDKFTKEYLIQVDIRPYTKQELAYWNQYGINKEDLKEYDIYSIGSMWVNKKKVPDATYLRFGYYFPESDRWKIYSPETPNFKWFGNVSNRELEGHIKFQGARPIIITKSRKDRIILSKLYPYVLSAQNESEAAIPVDFDTLLNKFPAKYCWFDSDEPGKAANKKLNYRGYKWINIPNNLYTEYRLKDPGDVIKFFGIQSGQKILIDEMKKKGII